MTRLPRPAVGDLVAGVSVGLVLLPQSLAYATLAGMPAYTGLLVAGAATIVAAPFASSPVLQTGPTAVTALLTIGTLAPLAEPGSLEYVHLAGLLALMVGAVRIAVGLGRAGEIAFVLSRPVLSGFTFAAAIVIAASQVPDLLGVEVSAGNVIVAAALALGRAPAWDPLAIGLAGGTVLVMLGARRISPLVPGVLIAVVAGIVIARVTGYDGPVVGEIPTGLVAPALAFPWGSAQQLVVPSLVIALVGFAEVSAIARTYEAAIGGRWDPDREFVGQGVANLASGLVGGFPVGGSFSRSALNSQAGAASVWSGVIAGAVVLLALPFAGAMERLPQAVLAGIIVGAVLRLMHPRPLLQLRRYSRQQLGVATVTAALTLALAPQIHWAVVIGVALAIGAHLRRERELAVTSWREGGVLHVAPVGVLYFGSARRFEEQLTDLLAGSGEVDALVIHFDAVGRTDVTGAMSLRRVLLDARGRGMQVELAGLTPPSRKIVERVVAGDPRDRRG